jgi:transposase
LSAGERLVARREHAVARVNAFGDWVESRRVRVSKKSPLGEALSYIFKLWTGLNVYLADGRVEIDSNCVERAIRPIALNRKNALFAGHDAGGENWGIIASLIETAKLNNLEPFAYLRSTLEAIAAGHRQSRIYELLPWNYGAPAAV